MRIFFILCLLFFANPVCAGVDMDEVDDAINLGSASDIDNFFDDGGTVACWGNFSSFEGNDGRLFGNTASGDNTGIVLAVDTSTIEMSFFQAGTSTFYLCSATTTGVPINEWHHFALTWDGSVNSSCSGTIPYFDGTAATWSATQGAGSKPDTSSGNNIIGNCALDGNCTANGTYSECVIYDSVLTAAQVKALADPNMRRQAYNISPSTLLRYFPMDEKTTGSSFDGSNTIIDLTGNDHADGDNGSNNTGLTAVNTEPLAYP